MTHVKTPRLTLVGAGPGDKDLISVKGLYKLKSADVILYDALVNTELFENVSENILKIYVGKRRNQHSYTQGQINDLIVDLAFIYGHVVRLKGGDSFVFGRGMEEIQHAESFNIETEVIPGISSATSVPGMAGIPVTNRGTSESFWVLTGTTKNNTLSADIKLAAKTDATIIILMGLSKLKEIVEIFINEGKGKLAVAIIQDGSLPTQNTAIGTIDTIIDIAEDEDIQAPAVIVIGAVVGLNNLSKLSKYNIRSLLN